MKYYATIEKYMNTRNTGSVCNMMQGENNTNCGQR